MASQSNEMKLRGYYLSLMSPTNKRVSRDLKYLFKCLETKPRYIKARTQQKRIEAHHTIAVNKSIDHVCWHLEHLFNSPVGYEGFKTIEEMTMKEHRQHHAKEIKNAKRKR